jgi:hypothetical protein
MPLDSRRRWFALYVLCLGSLMIVLDTERLFPLFGLPPRLDA